MANSPSLRTLYTRESSRIRKAFDARADGCTAAHQRRALVDKIVSRLWQEIIAGSDSFDRGLCLIARGGYGRGALLPHSDVDVLFLSDDPAVLNRSKDAIGMMCQQMWDLGMRVAPTVRTLAGCSEFDSENVELTLSLLETRPLAGNDGLCRQLREEAVPKLVRRHWPELVEAIVELTRRRHAKYGNTVFHLEPNVKEGPGGLRDLNVCGWLRAVISLKTGGIPPGQGFARREQQEAEAFLVSTRCFLHYMYSRDDNTVRWEAQDAAAARGVGLDGHPCDNTAAWTRNYFRHARQISRSTDHLLDEAEAHRSSLYRQFLNWRSRVSNRDFVVVGGRVYLHESHSAGDPDVVLRLFEFVAHHGFTIAADTQMRIENAMPSLSFPAGAELWTRLRSILVANGAADALRDMHAAGVLHVVIPEYRLIDSLIIRDFYHRYTVDEHSFMAIESLHHLKRSESDVEKRFATILDSIEQPELLYLAVLFHDLGKGTSEGPHAEASVRLSQAALDRLALPADQRETVLFLIANHLEMSAALRRDIYDRENVRLLAQKVGCIDRLRMLCMLTYADIRAVNPQALSPWKAEDLWHLYIGACNELQRSADAASAEVFLNEQAQQTVSTSAGHRKSDPTAGLPERYARMNSAEQVALHSAMTEKLAVDPVQVNLRHKTGVLELTVVTRDRRGLFATVCGLLTAWNMDIVKANAFTSQTGIVVDTVLFRDRYRTIEFNAGEKDRFLKHFAEVIHGSADLSTLIKSRITTGQIVPPKVFIDTRITLDNESSSHSTLLEVVAQDRAGLLYCIASCLAAHRYDIDIALVDTEGQMAIDVFYITDSSAKLDANQRTSLRRALYEELAAKWEMSAAPPHTTLSTASGWAE